MTRENFVELADAIADESFPEVDLALRRGRHIDREDHTWYTFLIDAQPHLEAFYRRFGCELVHRSDGFFYLLPTNDRLGKRHLSLPEMLVGQALTLLYLDANTVQQGGLATREQLLETLAAVMGTESLVRTLNPKRKRYDERVAQETVRAKVADAVRRLSVLGFVDLLDGEQLRLRSSLMRFAEPVRGVGAPADALERLVAQGEAILADGGDDIFDSEDDESAPEIDGAESDAEDERVDNVVHELAEELGSGLFEGGGTPNVANAEAPLPFPFPAIELPADELELPTDELELPADELEGDVEFRLDDYEPDEPREDDA